MISLFSIAEVDSTANPLLLSAQSSLCRHSSPDLVVAGRRKDNVRRVWYQEDEADNDLT